MTNKSTQQGLTFQRHFTKEDCSPFEQFNYEVRTSEVRNAAGEQVFYMDHVEVPDHWSQLATDILAQKYFRQRGVPEEISATGAEYSIKQVAHRLASCWRSWGEQYGYFASAEDARVFYDELVYCLLDQRAAPNSPQWFNAGLYNTYGIEGKPQGHYYVDPETEETKQSESAYGRPQVHACFILSVDDDLVNEGGIMDLWQREARIFKYGSGVGTNYSSIRAKGEKLSGGGSSSGLMSFLKVGDQAAGAIKSGGTTRRAAKMVVLDMDHPEIKDFVSWKMDEEKKVEALRDAGYDAGFEGEAYQTVSGQNSNNSIRVSNDFFHAMETDDQWTLRGRVDKDVNETFSASELWEQVGQAAWHCGDPGIQYDTTINEWNTCPQDGRVNASNPCSEYLFLDNTACNLASVNLRKFWDKEEQRFDVESFQYACRLWTVVLEVSVLMAQFPSEEIARRSFDYRTLGLGYANLGSLLMAAGIPYNSAEGRNLAASITSLMTGTAYKTSAEMASVLGPFPKFEHNREDMLRVLRNHRSAAYNSPEAFEGLEITPSTIDENYCPDYLLNAASQIWDEVLQEGEQHGFRNAQVSVIAPTGTIGLVMDCDTTGVEPDFALVKFKKLVGGGGVKLVNHAVPEALQTLGYDETQIDDIIRYVNGNGTFRGAPYINHDALLEAGFSEQELETLDQTAVSAYDISGLFQKAVLGEELFTKLGVGNRQGHGFLKALGFTDKEIEMANEYVCGFMTVEGAPHLKTEHLPVFDCAMPCGKGERSLSPHSHMDMMASVQPFISGGISKTVNLPSDASPDDIGNYYLYGWKSGLKACAVYRDGSKVSQPLTGKKKTENEEDDTIRESAIQAELENISPDRISQEQVLEAARQIINEAADTTFKKRMSRIIERKKLPTKRQGFTEKAKINGQTIFVRTGEYEDGTLGEVFIDMYKEGVSFRSMLNCFSISISIGLQYGVPLKEFVDKFVCTRFDPAGMVEHPHIKNASSVLDYVFRLLAWEYLGMKDLLHVPPENGENRINALQNQNNGHSDQRKMSSEKAEDVYENQKADATLSEVREHQMNAYMEEVAGDAPPCDVCGHITVRSGTCYKCLNCGASLGCS